jgi:hypothetical protein
MTIDAKTAPWGAWVMSLLVNYICAMVGVSAMTLVLARCQRVCDADSPDADLAYGGGYRCNGAHECPVLVQ